MPLVIKRYRTGTAPSWRVQSQLRVTHTHNWYKTNSNALSVLEAQSVTVPRLVTHRLKSGWTWIQIVESCSEQISALAHFERQCFLVCMNGSASIIFQKMSACSLNYQHLYLRRPDWILKRIETALEHCYPSIAWCETKVHLNHRKKCNRAQIQCCWRRAEGYF